MAYHQVFFTGKGGNKIDFNCFVFGSYFRSLLRADAVIFVFLAASEEVLLLVIYLFPAKKKKSILVRN
jgi:hypothetical protein